MVNILKNILSSSAFEELISSAIEANEWFSESDIRYAVRAIEADFLDTPRYVAPINQKIGILCAGNIPLVGFGDMYYALLAGCQVYLKPSRRDILMNAFDGLVNIVGSIDDFEVVDQIWAMGSDEVCEILKTRYPEKRLLLRGSRHSIAIIDGTETEVELQGLSDDIFLYCGMGCRSVAHIYLPRGYNISKLQFPLCDMPSSWSDAYRYAKAMATMRGESFIDGGFYILKQGPTSAVGTIGYSFYDNISQIDISDKKCVVGHAHTPFGRGQHPDWGTLITLI